MIPTEFCIIPAHDGSWHHEIRELNRLLAIHSNIIIREHITNETAKIWVLSNENFENLYSNVDLWLSLFDYMHEIVFRLMAQHANQKIILDQNTPISEEEYLGSIYQYGLQPDQWESCIYMLECVFIRSNQHLEIKPDLGRITFTPPLLEAEALLLRDRAFDQFKQDREYYDRYLCIRQSLLEDHSIFPDIAKELETVLLKRTVYAERYLDENDVHTDLALFYTQEAETIQLLVNENTASEKECDDPDMIIEDTEQMLQSINLCPIHNNTKILNGFYTSFAQLCFMKGHYTAVHTLTDHLYKQIERSIITGTVEYDLPDLSEQFKILCMQTLLTIRSDRSSQLIKDRLHLCQAFVQKHGTGIIHLPQHEIDQLLQRITRVISDQKWT